VIEENTSLLIIVAEEDEGKRLDAYLAERIDGWSRSRLQKLVDEGEVPVNHKIVKSSYRVETGDEIEVELTALPSDSFLAQDIPLDIVYEDDDIAVINKAAGMVVHPGAGVHDGTMANALAFHFAKLATGGGVMRPGIVHRLDKDTSGLIVVAKNDAAHENLSAQFGEREVRKTYLALVHGVTAADGGRIEAAIGRDRQNRTRMAVVRSGRSAVSIWKVRERFERFTLLDVEIKTGRTHQIRVHLASVKHPVVGDETYNNGRDKTIAEVKHRKAVSVMDRFFLHAERLGFFHPATKEWVKFVAPLPPELETMLEALR
jgi:23S rRNA pseudouridine1911/1915/1917 synthase